MQFIYSIENAANSDEYLIVKPTDIDDCLPNPCQNNGTCTDLVNNYKCYCVTGFDGTNCEKSKKIHMFLYFGKVHNM